MVSELRVPKTPIRLESDCDHVWTAHTPCVIPIGAA